MSQKKRTSIQSYAIQGLSSNLDSRSKSNSKSSPKRFTDIPDDVITEIVSRLYPTERKKLAITSKSVARMVEHAEKDVDTWKGHRTPLKDTAHTKETIIHQPKDLYIEYKINTGEKKIDRLIHVFGYYHWHSKKGDDYHWDKDRDHSCDLEVYLGKRWLFTISFGYDSQTKEYDVSSVYRDLHFENRSLALFQTKYPALWDDLSFMIRNGMLSPYFVDMISRMKKQFPRKLKDLKWEDVKEKINKNSSKLMDYLDVLIKPQEDPISPSKQMLVIR